MQDTDTETENASERKWREVQEELDRGDRREYHNYSYHDQEYIDNTAWDSTGEMSDVTQEGERGWLDRERSEYYDTRSWDRRNRYGSGNTTVGWNDYDYGSGGTSSCWRDWRDDYYGGYGYHRWKGDYDDRDNYRGRRWSYDSYYDKESFNDTLTIRCLGL